MISKRQLRLLHRYIGAVVAIFVVLLATTGILLNHTDTLQLQEKQLRQPALLHWYGIQPPEITSFMAGNTWISSDTETAYFNTMVIEKCAKLTGALKTPQMILVSCENSLLLLTDTGELIEAIDADMGLPLPISGLSSVEDRVYLHANNTLYEINTDTLAFTPTDGLSNALIQPAQTPAHIKTNILQQSAAYSINLERVLLDIHSGRIGGNVGVWMMDIAAFFFMILAATGLWIWLRK
jgi:hypothetical protein